MDNGQHIGHGSIYRVALGIIAKFDGGGQHDGAPVIGLYRALLSLPSEAEFVGMCSSYTGTAVIATCRIISIVSVAQCAESTKNSLGWVYIGLKGLKQHPRKMHPRTMGVERFPEVGWQQHEENRSMQHLRTDANLPSPTSMTPVLPTLRSVLNCILVSTGLIIFPSTTVVS